MTRPGADSDWKACHFAEIDVTVLDGVDGGKNSKNQLGCPATAIQHYRAE